MTERSAPSPRPTATGVTASDESDRLRRVYETYDDTVEMRHRWDERRPGNARMIVERRHLLEDQLARRYPEQVEHFAALDIGCGVGNELAWLADLGIPAGRLHGVDLAPHRVEQAIASHPDMDLRVGDATELDFVASSVDIVLLFTVLSSVLDPGLRNQIAREAARVLRPGGAVLWYDFRVPSPRNPNVEPVTRRQLRAMFPGFSQDVSSLTLVPPLARRLGSRTTQLYPRLAALPFLRTHLGGLLVKPR